MFLFLLLCTSCADDPEGVIPSFQVRYKVEGSVPSASISIIAEENRNLMFSNQTLPWNYEFSKQVREQTYLYISAQHNQPDGIIVVVIYKDNRVFKSDTSIGEYARAEASGTL